MAFLQRWAHFLLSGLCHQLPAHSLHYAGHPLPLCARCAGTFMGVWIALLTLWTLDRGHRGRYPGRGTSMVLIALAAAWLVDGANSFAQDLFGVAIYRSSNALRLITGLGFGLAMGVILYPTWQLAFWRQAEGRKVIERPRELAPPLGIAAALAALMLGWPSAPYLLWWTPVVASAIGTVAILNATLLAVILHKEGFAERLTQTFPHHLVGLLLALLELAALASLRCWLEF